MRTFTVHQYDEYAYYTGSSKVITEFDPIERRWTTVDLPEIPEGQFAFFRDGGWVVTDKPRPVPIVDPDWRPGPDPNYVPPVDPSTVEQVAPEVL